MFNVTDFKRSDTLSNSMALRAMLEYVRTLSETGLCHSVSVIYTSETKSRRSYTSRVLMVLAEIGIVCRIDGEQFDNKRGFKINPRRLAKAFEVNLWGVNGSFICGNCGKFKTHEERGKYSTSKNICLCCAAMLNERSRAANKSRLADLSKETNSHQRALEDENREQRRLEKLRAREAILFADLAKEEINSPPSTPVSPWH